LSLRSYLLPLADEDPAHLVAELLGALPVETMEGKLVDERAKLGGGYSVCLNAERPSHDGVFGLGVSGFLPEVGMAELRPAWPEGGGFFQ